MCHQQLFPTAQHFSGISFYGTFHAKESYLINTTREF